MSTTVIYTLSLHDALPIYEKVRFYPATDRYKELLQYLNKLYEEELLNKDLYTVKSEEVRARGADGLFGSVIITDPTQYDEGEYIGLGALEEIGRASCRERG